MAEIDVTMKDNSAEVLRQFGLAKERVLFAIGLLGVEGCVEKASEIDTETGRPTVDTGRYRAGFGFITPTQGRMSSARATQKGAGDDFSGQRAEANTVIIANNVEYASYLEFGSGSKKDGKHARYIMKRGIESKVAKMEEQAKNLMQGKDVSLSIGNVTSGE